jgi:hypothetical protein
MENEALKGLWELVERMEANALPPHKDCTNGWAAELRAELEKLAIGNQGWSHESPEFAAVNTLEGLRDWCKANAVAPYRTELRDIGRKLSELLGERVHMREITGNPDIDGPTEGQLWVECDKDQLGAVPF